MSSVDSASGSFSDAEDYLTTNGDTDLETCIRKEPPRTSYFKSLSSFGLTGFSGSLSSSSSKDSLLTLTQKNNHGRRHQDGIFIHGEGQDENGNTTLDVRSKSNYGVGTFDVVDRAESAPITREKQSKGTKLKKQRPSIRSISFSGRKSSSSESKSMFGRSMSNKNPTDGVMAALQSIGLVVPSNIGYGSSYYPTMFALEEKRIGEVSMDPTLCADFLTQYKRKLKDNFLTIEFKALGRVIEDYPQLIGGLPCNFLKNNSRNILPYDHSRVCLEAPPTQVDSDYINASLIYRMQGNKKVKAYIAAQGPLANTVTDFWRMVWQEGVNTIVMLTNVFSYSKQECEKYWHNTYSMYGDIHVRQESTVSTCHYTVRYFSISKVGFQKARQLAHFQFHTWTEQEVPDCPAVLEFRRKIKIWYTTYGGQSPVLVHCGDGAGRTGAYITLDIVLDNIRDRGTVDILTTINSIRRFRPSLIDHLNQLHFIYQCVSTLLTCGTTVIKTGEIGSLVQQMARRDSSTKTSGFEKEYKTLREITPRLTIGDCAGGHRVENRRKSRDIMIQPPERARPYLMTFDSSDSSDFVNAVYVNGYKVANEFIVSQWPMKNTCKDFWRLIFDAHITSVVVLHDCTVSRSFPEFWPKKEGVKERYGPVCSTLVRTEHTPSLVIKTFNVKKKILYKNLNQHIHEMGQRPIHIGNTPEARQNQEALVNPADISSFGGETRPVQVMFLKNWPDSQKVPLQNYSLLDLIENTNQWKDTHIAQSTPTLVISKNGVSRAGVYCAASICLDKLNNEGEVDVFNATRTVMHNRPQLIENLVEYTYMYTFMKVMSEQLVPSIRDDSYLSPLMIDTSNHNHQSSYAAHSPNHSSNAESTRPLIQANNSATETVSVSSRPSLGKTSTGPPSSSKTSSQMSGLPSTRTSMLASDSLSSRAPSSLMNGHVPPTVKPEKQKFTDGKGFLHYAQPIEITEEEKSLARYHDDNISTASSFKMDSDILSLENAEFALQSYNNMYIQQLANDEKFYAANSIL